MSSCASCVYSFCGIFNRVLRYKIAVCGSLCVIAVRAPVNRSTAVISGLLGVAARTPVLTSSEKVISSRDKTRNIPAFRDYIELNIVFSLRTNSKRSALPVRHGHPVTEWQLLQLFGVTGCIAFFILAPR